MTTKEIRMRKIASIVCSKIGVDMDDLYTHSKEGTVCFARKMCWAITREIMGYSASTREIGATIAGRDHATVVCGIKSFAGNMEKDKHLRSYYDEVLDTVKRSLGRDQDPDTSLKDRLMEVSRYDSVVNMRIELRLIANSINRM